MFKNIAFNYFGKTIKSSKNLLIRNFSSKQNLINSFTNEINYEETEYNPISEEERKVFFKNTGFEFIESDSSPRMELKKNVGGFQVQICYHARAPLPSPEDNQENQQQQEQESQEPGNMTDFQVLLTKDGKSSGFLVDAVVIDGQININHLYVNDNVQEFHSKFISGRIDPNLYEGPDFQSLDESLQTSFHEFLTELGVNEETATFIEVTSLDKDQRLYMNWLKTCKNNLL